MTVHELSIFYKFTVQTLKQLIKVSFLSLSIKIKLRVSRGKKTSLVQQKFK